MDRNISTRVFMLSTWAVEAREGLVDRNRMVPVRRCRVHVEAREGLVDRNPRQSIGSIFLNVEAREGLVDRNRPLWMHLRKRGASRLARASWIEIIYR